MEVDGGIQRFGDQADGSEQEEESGKKKDEETERAAGGFHGDGS